MDNQVLTDILAGYEQKRARNEMEETRRQEEIRAHHPDLAALIEKRHSMIMQSVRGAFAAAAPNDPEQLMADYNQKIAALLQVKGFPPDYLAPIYDCPHCRDTGYVYVQSLRTPCQCLKKAYENAMAVQGDAIQGDETFASFDESRFPDEALPKTDVTQREYMRLVRDKCLAYAKNIPNGGIRTLLLHGGSGLIAWEMKCSPGVSTSCTLPLMTCSWT